LLDEVNSGKQADPDNVDEVPVVRHNDGCGCLSRGELCLLYADQHHHECQNASQHVSCVEAGSDEENGTVDTVLNGETFAHQGDVLEDLANQEDGTHHDGDQVPLTKSEYVTFF